MGGPGRIREALVWWECGQAPCRSPGMARPWGPTPGTGQAHSCTQAHSPGAGSLLSAPRGSRPPFVGLFGEAEAKS